MHPTREKLDRWEPQLSREATANKTCSKSSKATGGTCRQQTAQRHRRQHAEMQPFPNSKLPSDSADDLWARKMTAGCGRGRQARCPNDQRRDNISKLMIFLSSGQLAAVLTLLVVAIFVKQSDSFFIDDKQSPHTSEWNYNDQLQWRQMHRECSGRAQSPIDIKHKNVIISQHLRLNFYNYDKQIRFKLSNAHHTVKMNPLGPAYDQDLDQHGHRSGLNSSSIHDMMTADEYVKFTPISDQHSSNGGGGDGKLGGGANNDHLSRLVASGSSAPRQLASRQQRPTEGQRAGASSDHQRDSNHKTDAIEHERESGGFGRGLFGLGLGRPQQVYEGAPTIKLDWLDDGNNEYKLRDIHFHWGERRDNGSEHAIDGRRAAMEMHLVHIKHGLDKSSISFTSDSVAVIAILIESHRKSNLDFNPIVNELARINSSEQAQEVDYKSLYDLLPNNLQAFYTYSGSLTTPPCYQVVNWIVMAERLNMNAKQIEMFRNLYAPPRVHQTDDMPAAADEMTNRHSGRHQHIDHNDVTDSEHSSLQTGSELELIMPNVRQLQTLNNRTILASFTKHGSRLDTVTSSAFNSGHSIRLIDQVGPQLMFALMLVQLSLWYTGLCCVLKM